MSGRPDDPFHAHIYFPAEAPAAAEQLRDRFLEMRRTSVPSAPCYVGELRPQPVGPHPIPQFEIHFAARDLGVLRPILQASGLRVLVHPLTDDDLADHTTLGDWIGEPLDLDLSVLDPPGVNQGMDRFGKSDF